MKRVLIVSYYFPPLNNIAAKRYGTMCKYFEKYSYEAYVLTVAVKDCNCLGAKKDLEIPVSAQRIIRIGKGKEAKGIDVKGLFVFLDLLGRLKLYCRAIMGYDEALWYENIREKLDLKKLKKIDLIIGTFGPIGNVYAAKYLSKKLHCPFIADIRDLISEWQEAPEGYHHCYHLDRLAEKRLLSSACGIVPVTHGFKKIFQKKYPSKRVVTVYNGWDKVRIRDIKKLDKEGNSDKKYMYYAGSLYEHRLESFCLLLNVMKQIQERERILLIVRSIGPKRLDEKARDLVSKKGLMDAVQILPSASQDIIYEEQEKACINIILSSVHEENRDQMVTVPGKTYELLKEKSPVLAVTSKKSDVAKILVYTKKGIATTSEDEMAQFILHQYRDYTGNENIKKFSREYQAKRLCRFMDEILNT